MAIIPKPLQMKAGSGEFHLKSSTPVYEEKGWEKCDKCQLRIKNEGLKDEHELQSYFISRMEKFINGKGRQIIGWDEILEGGRRRNCCR